MDGIKDLIFNLTNLGIKPSLLVIGQKIKAELVNYTGTALPVTKVNFTKLTLNGYELKIIEVADDDTLELYGNDSIYN